MMKSTGTDFSTDQTGYGTLPVIRDLYDDVDLRSGYHVITTADEEDELHSEKEPSLAKRAGAFVASLFTKAPDQVDRSSYEEIPDQPHRSFDEFLSVKAKDGFSTKDILAMRGVEFITAKGLWNNVKAFFDLGAIGYFFADKVTDSNRDALMAEANFYRQCCKVQDFYQAFQKKPDAANFKGLKTAYEAVLAMGKSSAQHDTINAIMNKHFAKGASVGEAILSHEAKTSLTSLGGFTADSIMETITGAEFLEGIQAKSAMGYRGRDLTVQEESVVGTANKRLIAQQEIKGILSDKSTRSIFLSYARVFNQLRDSEEAYTVCTDVVEALGESTVTKGQVDRRVASYNALLLDLVQNPTKTALASALPQVALDVLDEMTKVYAEHQANLAKQPQLMVELKAAQAAQKKADAALQKEGAKTRSCTLAEMEDVFGPTPNKDLPGARNYLIDSTVKAGLKRDLEAQKLAIEERKGELEKLVGKDGSLIVRENQLAQILADQDAIMEANAKLLEKTVFGVKTLAKEIRSGRDVTDANIGDHVKGASEQSIAALAVYRENAPKHVEVTKQIAVARAELALLNKDSADHPAIKERNSLAKQLALVEAKRFVLTHAQIAQIYADEKTFAIDALDPIVERMGQLKDAKDACDDAFDAKQEELDETAEEIDASIVSLASYGFEVSAEGVVGALNFASFDEEFKEGIEKTLAEQGPLSGRIVLALQAVASTPKEMHTMTLFNRGEHSSVDVVASRSGPVSLEMIKRKPLDEEERTETLFVRSPVSRRSTEGAFDPMKPPVPLVVPADYDRVVGKKKKETGETVDLTFLQEEF